MNIKINKLLVICALVTSFLVSGYSVSVSAAPVPISPNPTPTQIAPTQVDTCSDSTCGRCFNQLAGRVFYCSGGKFTGGTCWVYNINGGIANWGTAPCTLEQFKSIQPGSTGQTTVTTDPAACGKNIKTCCDTNAASTTGDKPSDCGFIKRINDFIAFLSVIVGIACAFGIIIGGIEYSMSGGDPKRAASGKNHITKAVIAVVLFGFLYAFLQFIVPGGFLNG